MIPTAIKQLFTSTTSPATSMPSRLIRFIPLSGSSSPLIGEPVDRTLDVGLALYEGKKVEVAVYSGSSVLSPGGPTGRKEVVGRLLSPLAESEIGTIRCIGLNYMSHALETKLPIPSQPVLFNRPSTSLNDPYPAKVIIPQNFADGADFEAEVAVIIGKEAKDVSEERALEYVAGITACHDVSSRVAQFAQSQWCFSKSWDGSCPLGPTFVPLNSIDRLEAVKVQGYLNGNEVQSSGLDDLIFSVQKVIAFISQGTTLPPGTVIITGTPGGVGWTREPKIILKHGDEFRVVVSHGVGSLINQVVVQQQKAKL